MSFKEINDVLKDVASRMIFKDITRENDTALIILERALWWVVISRIGEENEKGVREVVIKLLSIPPLEMHFHLTNDQLDGETPFLIEGGEAFIKAVDFSSPYLSDSMEEIYVKDHDEDNEDEDNIKVPGSTLVN